MSFEKHWKRCLNENAHTQTQAITLPKEQSFQMLEEPELQESSSNHCAGSSHPRTKRNNGVILWKCLFKALSVFIGCILALRQNFPGLSSHLAERRNHIRATDRIFKNFKIYFDKIYFYVYKIIVHIFHKYSFNSKQRLDPEQ